MNPRERLLTALEGGTPDRLPVTVHQWQRYHLDAVLGGMGELEAFARFGLDAAVQHVQRGGQFWLGEADYSPYSTPEWRDRVTVLRADPDDWDHLHTVETPGGTLTYRTAGNRATTWLTKHLIERDEDIDRIERYMPVLPLAPAPVRALREEIGDRGILRGFVWGDQGGCWQHACCLMQPSELILATFDKPDWVHRLLEVLLAKKLRYVESMAGAPYDLVETGGGSACTTLISPKIHAEFCLPYDRRLHDALHSLGFRITYHTCGGTRGIEEMIVANGTDASETLAAPSIGGNSEPWDFAAKIAGRLALIGGLDQVNVLTKGPPPAIRAAVHTLFERVGANGGYILSCSDHFFDTPAEHLRAYAEAARECVY
ncbi:MAG: uroporphyrinogen decarboxylase family protein [Planctomycetota bacterium]